MLNGLDARMMRADVHGWGRRVVFAGLAMSTCFAAGCAGAGGKGVAIGKVETAADLKAKMDARSVTVIDTLDDAHYKEGHIPGARHCDYEKMSADQLPADKNAPIVFYCAGGMCPVSRYAADKAVKYGYTQVSVYEGGLKGWKAAGMPVATGAN